MRHNFEECIARLLEHEGGYVWHAEDPGGETNLGVAVQRTAHTLHG